MLFGIRSCPLLWGRIVAIIVTVIAVNAGDWAKLQCFVDDPAVTVCGNKSRRRCLMCRTIMFWTALGAKLAWKKGQIGQRPGWIGAVFRPWAATRDVQGVTVGVSKERMAKLFKSCEHTEATHEQIPSTGVRQLAGLATWMSGVMQHMSAFTRILWVAAASSSGSVVARRQVTTPLRWFSLLAQHEFSPIERRCRRRPQFWTVNTSTAP